MPKRTRSRSAKVGVQDDRWPTLEREHISRNLDWYNENLIGDWIVYVLRKETAFR